METRADTYSSEVIERRWLSNRSFELTLKKPSAFEYTPGQWIRLIHDAIERDYTLVSAPTEPTLALCIRNVDAGRLTPELSHAPVGTLFTFNGPHGYFTFKSSIHPPVFVATGTGVAPFVSMARAGVTGFTLVHGVRSAAENYYASELKSAAKQYVLCLSETHPSGDDFFQGRVTDFLYQNLAPGSYDFYLCGRREMIRDVINCVDDKFPESLVFTEIFY